MTMSLRFADDPSCGKQNKQFYGDVDGNFEVTGYVWKIGVRNPKDLEVIDPFAVKASPNWRHASARFDGHNNNLDL